MNTELQNKVWSILPKEFKEKVKEIYLNAVAHHPCGYNHKTDLLKYLFGIHNLTSDAEGDDEMLTVIRKQIDALQGEIFKAIMDAHDADDWQDAAHYILDVMPRSFAALFGSKCLSDETCNVASNVASSEPKPSEPKFKVGDKIRLKDVYEINEVDEDMARVSLKGRAYMEDFDNLELYTEQKLAEPKFKIGDKVRVKFNAKELHSNPDPSKKIYYWQTTRDKYLGKVFKITDIWKSRTITLNTAEIMFWEPFDLEPYTEPEENQTLSDSTELKSQDVDKHFDNILKDRFRDYNRLHIAAMAMQGILSNADRMKVYERIATEPPCEELAVVVACNALRYADTLMVKAKKGE